VRRAAVALWLGLAPAGPALAAGGEGGGGLGDLLWPSLNLALLVAALVYFARRPVQDFFAARGSRIRGDIDGAAQLLADAEARHAQGQRKLAELDRELAGIREMAKQRAEAERDHILADAKLAAERIRGDARAAVDQELRRAREDLRREAADLAIELAAQTLRAGVTDADRSRLVDEFIDTIERGGRQAAAGSGR
jgi:F-type H+-transporting ATPase subunit b